MKRVLCFAVAFSAAMAMVSGCSDSDSPRESPLTHDILGDDGKSSETSISSTVILLTGVRSICEIAGAGGVPIIPPRDVVMTPNSTGDWYVSSDQDGNLRRMNWRGRIGIDNWEFRFVPPDSGSEYYDWASDLKWPDRCPFRIWNTGPDENPSDDRRIQLAIIDDDGSGGWSYGDRIYPFEREYYEPLPSMAQYTWDEDFHIGRIMFNDYSGATDYPALGTVVLFETTKPDHGINASHSFVATPLE